MMRKKLILLFAVVWLMTTAVAVYAHGARISYTVNTTVTITAAYDSGEPMAGAQVSVYAPDNPTTAWLTGVADADGRFAFAPDPAIPGVWDVQARQAGHGAVAHIPVEANLVASGATGFTPWQIIVMSGSVIWGFIGVAAYFSRPREATNAHS